MSIDIKDFFLMHTLPEGNKEYMRIHGKYFDNEYKTLHNLHNKVNEDGYVCCEIQLGMYGLKQAATISYTEIWQCLSLVGYYSIKESNGLWRHKERRTIFALTVDDFGIKYFSKEDAVHLIETLQKHHKVSIDWDGTNYCGLKFEWNYKD